MRLYQLADVVNENEGHDYKAEQFGKSELLYIRLRPAQEARFLTLEQIHEVHLLDGTTVWVLLDNKGNLIDYIY